MYIARLLCVNLWKMLHNSSAFLIRLQYCVCRCQCSVAFDTNYTVSQSMHRCDMFVRNVLLENNCPCEEHNVIFYRYMSSWFVKLALALFILSKRESKVCHSSCLMVHIVRKMYKSQCMKQLLIFPSCYCKMWYRNVIVSTSNIYVWQWHDISFVLL